MIGRASQLHVSRKTLLKAKRQGCALSRQHDRLPNQHASSRQNDSLALALISISTGPLRVRFPGMAGKR